MLQHAYNISNVMFNVSTTLSSSYASPFETQNVDFFFLTRMQIRLQSSKLDMVHNISHPTSHVI